MRYILPTILFVTLSLSSSLVYAKNPAVVANSSTISASNSVAVSGRLYFKDLRKWRMGANEAPADLKQFNGKVVEIVGYMVPFDSIEKIDRFILLQAPFMGCFHVPPPQPNETLMINSDTVMPDYVYEPIKITGVLTIEETFVDRFLVSMYTIDAQKIETVRQDDAETEGLPPNFHMFGEF